MTALLDGDPYGTRHDEQLVGELEALTEDHRAGCPDYARIVADWRPGAGAAGLPFVHVGLFKDRLLRTERPEVRHQRTLLSSATSSGTSSQVVLDERSSALQAESSQRILRAWLGDVRAPLVVLDSASSLRGRGGLSARLAAALSLRPLATDLHFVLPDAARPDQLAWDAVARAASAAGELLVYGFTWILWTAWVQGDAPDAVRDVLRGTRIRFVHSGGWKKLEAARVGREQFDGALLAGVGPGSVVLDYYGLVEQVGMVYPLCEAGARHVPRWGEVIVRDPWTLEPTGGIGQLQLLNPLALGAPYHSVLTEDMGQLGLEACPCGRGGRTFVLAGRVPKAELRGCANV